MALLPDSSKHELFWEYYECVTYPVAAMDFQNYTCIYMSVQVFLIKLLLSDTVPVFTQQQIEKEGIWKKTQTNRNKASSRISLKNLNQFQTASLQN